jgi:hypothetical protein
LWALAPTGWDRMSRCSAKTGPRCTRPGPRCRSRASDAGGLLRSSRRARVVAGASGVGRGTALSQLGVRVGGAGPRAAPGRSLAARRARAGAAAGGFVNSLGLGKVPSMKPLRRRRPWLGAVGHTSPRPSRAPASSEQRGSQDARADPNAGLGGPANQIRASRQKQGVVRPTSMSTDKATRRPRRRPGSLPYRRDPSSAGPARACSGRRAGARVKTAAWRRNRRSTVTRSSSTSLLPWTIRSSAARGPQLRNRAIAMRQIR